MSKINKKPTQNNSTLKTIKRFRQTTPSAMRRRVGEAGYKGKYLTCKQ
jgi:hypothetical protein